MFPLSQGELRSTTTDGKNALPNRRTFCSPSAEIEPRLLPLFRSGKDEDAAFVLNHRLFEHLLVELVDVVAQVGDAVRRLQVEIGRDVGAGDVEIKQAAAPLSLGELDCQICGEKRAAAPSVGRHNRDQASCRRALGSRLKQPAQCRCQVLMKVAGLIEKIVRTGV